MSIVPAPFGSEQQFINRPLPEEVQLDPDAFPPEPPMSEVEIDALYVAEMERRDAEEAAPRQVGVCRLCNKPMFDNQRLYTDEYADDGKAKVHGACADKGYGPRTIKQQVIAIQRQSKAIAQAAQEIREVSRLPMPGDKVRVRENGEWYTGKVIRHSSEKKLKGFNHQTRRKTFEDVPKLIVEFTWLYESTRTKEFDPADVQAA